MRLVHDLRAVAALARDKGFRYALGAVRKVVLYRLHWWFHDRALDHRYGATTRGGVTPDQLTVTGPNRDLGIEYMPTPGWVLRRILQRLPGAPAEFVFVDVGAGKGRMLLVAAELGYKRVVGVEFARELIDIARANAAGQRRRRPDATEVEVLHEDATTFAVPDEPCVFFLYHPFDAPVLEAFVENVRRFWEHRPRPIYLVYVNPVHEAVLARAGFLHAATHRFRDGLTHALSPHTVTVYAADR